MNDAYDYAAMSRAELLRHVTAYAEALHTLAGRCMAAEMRLQHLDKMREHFDRFRLGRIKVRLPRHWQPHQKG